MSEESLVPQQRGLAHALSSQSPARGNQLLGRQQRPRKEILHLHWYCEECLTAWHLSTNKLKSTGFGVATESRVCECCGTPGKCAGLHQTDEARELLLDAYEANRQKELGTGLIQLGEDNDGDMFTEFQLEE